MDGLVSLSLFWRVCLINGVVLAVAIGALALSPVTVSSRPVRSEVVVLVAGFVLTCVLNGLLLRSVLRPLDHLTGAMGGIDLREPGRRLEVPGSGPARALVSRFNEMLERLERERSESTELALRAQEDERERIARELHDEVGQSLTAVLLALQQASGRAGDEAAADLDAARETTRASLEEVRRISQRLRPGVLSDLGLLNSLSSLASELAARGGPEVRRAFAPGLPALTSEAELVVYRVAQEALTNTARHAGARQVEIGLGRQGDHLVLWVADDGTGRGAFVEGAGIQGMRERARMVRGHLHLGERSGGGTVVELRLPLSQEGA